MDLSPQYILTNDMAYVMMFFSIPDNPVEFREFMRFWDSLSLKEKDYYEAEAFAWILQE